MKRSTIVLALTCAASAMLAAVQDSNAQEQDRQAPRALSASSGDETARVPFGPLPVLHPGVAAVIPYQYYKPARRVDFSAQAAGAPVPMSQSGGVQGQTLVPAAKAPFALVEYGPNGNLGNATDRPQVYLTFSQPMVPVARLGAPMDRVAGVSITPPLEGRWQWISTKSLAFDPDESIARFVQYSVKADESLVSLYGDKLKATSFSFYTGTFSMRSVGSRKTQGKTQDLSAEELRELIVSFNMAVSARAVEPALELRGPSGSYRLAASNWDPVAKAATTKETNQVLLQVMDAVPEDQQLSLILKAGTKPGPSSVATEFDAALGLGSLKPFEYHKPWGDRVMEGLYRYRADDANAIWLQFSHPVMREGLEKAVTIVDSKPASTDYDEYRAMKNPSVVIASDQGEVEIPASAIEVFGTRVRINGLRFKLTPTYRVSVSTAVRDIYGRGLSEGGSFMFRLGNPMSYVYFPHTGTHMLEASFPPRVIAEVQDAEFLRYTVHSWERGTGAWNDGYQNEVDLSKLPPMTKHFEVLDLTPWLNKDGKGHLLVQWRAKDQGRYPRDVNPGLDVQVTDLAITARVAYNLILCRVTSISTGKPVAGAEVRLLDYRTERMALRTDADGVAAFPLEPGEYRSAFYSRVGSRTYPTDNLLVTAEKDSDYIEWTPSGHDAWRFDVAGRTSAASAESIRKIAFMFSDRKIYRPGETASFRGIDRVLALGVYSPPAPTDYRLRLVSRETGEVVAQSEGTTLATGGFWGSFELPADLPPGGYAAEYCRLDGGKVSASAAESIIVSNFRRLQFESFFDAPTLPALAGDDVSMTLNARYLAGGSMRDASYSGYWTREPYAFAPADRALAALYYGQEDEWAERSSLSSFSGSLDGEGRAAVGQQTGGDGVKGKAYRYRAQASVTDPLTGQSVSAAKSIVVYPAEFLVGGGVRAETSSAYGRYFAAGKKLALDFAMAAPDGGRYLAGPTRRVGYKIVRKEWKLVQQQGLEGVDSRWETVDVPVASGEATSAGPIGSVPFAADKAGQYSVVLSAADSKGRLTACTFNFWVTGREWVNWYSGNAAGISLSTERPSYAPGETARVLMRSPLPAGTYLVTTEREGIMSRRVVTFDGPTQVLEIPVEEKHVPVFYVAVATYSVRSGPPEHRYGQPDLDKPKSYFGLTQVRVDAGSRRIQLEIRPDAPSYEPGSKASFTVRATRDGKPEANAELLLMAVDRGVVDIVDYHVPDPMAFFYNRAYFPLGTRGGDSRDMLMDPVTYEVKDQFGGDSGKDQERKDFNPTAVFVPAVITDGSGEATVSFTWPDNLTTYRCTVVAVTADRFGLAEKEIQVRNPVNVKTNMPRKMRVRDTAMAGVIVTNMDAKAQTVTVSASSSILTLLGERTKTAVIQPGTTVEIAFAFGAERRGDGDIVFETRCAVHNETLRESYSVEEPSTFETTASIGSVGRGSAKGLDSFTEGIVLPMEPAGSSGSLELTLGASRLPMLGSAMNYVFNYPFGCNEQLCSKLLPLIAFGEYAEAYGLDSRVSSPRSVAERVMAEIAATQRPDGGFGLWAWSDESLTYVSLRVAQAANLMADKGWSLPRSLKRDKLHEYLQQAIKKASPFEQAYGTLVLAEAGVLTKADAETRLRGAGSFRFGEWSLMGLAFLELEDPARARQCLEKARAYIRQSPRSIDVEGSGWNEYNTSLVSLALFLELQSTLDPASDIASRIIQTMVDDLGGGYWQSTNTTYWVLHAFAAVIKAEGGAPDFRARVSVGGKEILTSDFRALSGRRETWKGGLSAGPLASLTKEKLLPLVFERDGSGNLYYGSVMRYAVPTETALNRDQGLEVVSRFSFPDGAPLGDAPLKRGSLYRLTVTVSNDRKLHNVAVRMPIPAGADIVESYGQGRRGADDDGDYYASSRIKAFDTEAHAYVDTMYAGTHSYSILFRATAAGIYTVPSASAECMYEPEIFGRDVATLMLIGL
ncbi:MAG: hypothetical protein KKB59_13130 [Spirochaetes bacterium]|nr:hypothetical protein [Spirochaetota bacterium]